jgi:chemotaxis protein MotB
MTHAHKQSGLAMTMLGLAILSGCATQDALNEQTEPIRASVAKLDQALQATTGAANVTQEELAAARAREKSLSTRLDDLVAEVKALREQAASRAREADMAGGQLRDADSLIRESLAKSDGRLDSVTSLARDIAARVDAQGEALRAATSESSALAGRLGHAEQGLAQLGSRVDNTRDQVARLDARVGDTERTAERFAAQLVGMNQDTSALRREIDQASALAKELAERAGRTDARVEQLASALPERMSRLESRMDELARLARSAMELAAQQDIRTNGKVAFSSTLTEDKTLYPLNLQYLGARDRAQLDGLVKRVKALDKDYHLEIQGHTDNTSVDDYNYQLGKARAEVVKRYLHEQGGIPLGWMSVISYGATQPIDPKSNNNRRIVIQVLVLDPNK